ncbi:hypothetical protein [Nocardioides sp.]|uniref:hypothetical protein n=1 Tax=Nocardioides sp. TaxID=35761 RepID=UPI002BE86CA7|nr:hypothetical protein [Nocardioides sp.]HXH78174.1 hypothetical protein [Nocardioides sp.]
MFIANQSNDIRTLTTAADGLGVTLPGSITTMLDHLREMQADQQPRPDLNGYTTDLATHLGDRAAMVKARKVAALDLAAADAHQRITGPLIDRCAKVVHQRVREARDEITALFATALAPQLDILNTEAGRLPAGFKPEHAADLDPALFEAWSRARDAHAVLRSARQSLAMFYRVSPDNLFTIEALLALAYAAPPKTFTDYTYAYRFARALAGIRHAGSDLGVLNTDGVFAPTALAHLGATFEWAGPTEVARRMQTITAAAVQPKTERVGV